MIAGRPDWCLSRQRAWGVPIVAVHCRKCGDVDGHCRSSRAVPPRSSRHEGADAWFARPVADFLPPGLRCPACGGGEFDRETDILDVWFDSGVSFAAVVEADFGDGHRRRPLPRGQRPASRLVPFGAARVGGHARPRAVPGGAHARLRARRRGPQAVEVARQHDRAPGHPEDLRRRHPAPVGGVRGLQRGRAHLRGDPEAAGRLLPPHPQHRAQPARQPRRLRSGDRQRGASPTATRSTAGSSRASRTSSRAAAAPTTRTSSTSSSTRSTTSAAWT